MRRAAFVAACGAAAVAGVAAGVADWLVKRAIRTTNWGTAEEPGQWVPFYEEPQPVVDLGDYEAHSIPHAEWGNRDGLTWHIYRLNPN